MLNEFVKNFREEHARLKGEAVSKARRIRPLAEIRSGGREDTGEAAKPTDVMIRMLDGAPMRYHTDGSLRHATGYKPGKAARKALKKARRQNAAKSTRTIVDESQHTR